MNNDQALSRLCADYAIRADNLGLKPGTQKFLRDQEAYIDGGTRALVGAGMMTPDFRDIIGLLTMSGRLPAFVLEKAQDRKEPA